MAGELDDSQTLEARDSQGLFEILADFDGQMERALEIGTEPELSVEAAAVRNVLYCGLGGSAIGGDLLRSYLGREVRVPFQVNRSYSLPGWVNASTLVVICSYSGKTEETVSLFEAAREAGAALLAVSSGGEVESMALEEGVPLVKVPEGHPPRMALAYLLVPVLRAFARIGLVEEREEEMRESLPWIRRKLEGYGPQVAVEENPAKSLAARLQGRIPVVYGSQDRLDAVAVRWRGQIQENAKQLVHSNALPEMNHNEIVGWKNPAVFLRQFLPIFLRDHEDHPRIQIRAEITRELLAERAGEVLEYWSQGDNWWQRLWSLVLLGDFASLYLAVLNEEDPGPVKVINELKERMRAYP